MPMPKPTPHLTTRRPSPTTVEYTVSTRPSPQTLPLTLLSVFIHLVRINIALLVITLLLAKFGAPTYLSGVEAVRSDAEIVFWSLQNLERMALVVNKSQIFKLFEVATERVPWWALLAGGSAILYTLTLRLYITETLLILRGLGIQTSSSSPSYFSSPVTRFIPTDKIQDIYINEAFMGFEVRYLLVVVVEGEEKVVVVFPRLLPRRNAVEKVWRGAKACLFEGVSMKATVKEEDIY